MDVWTNINATAELIADENIGSALCQRLKAENIPEDGGKGHLRHRLLQA